VGTVTSTTTRYPANRGYNIAVHYHHYQPAYGGYYYVYDERPYYAPGYFYSPAVVDPSTGQVIRGGGFNWGGFLLTLLVIAIIIVVIAKLAGGNKTTTRRADYY
jgi:hypothetical protein